MENRDGQRNDMQRKRASPPIDTREKKETRPKTRNEGLEKHTSPHRAIPAIVENVENLEFIRKSLWKSTETRVFQSLFTANRQAIDQAIKHVHSFQHASDQAFLRSLYHYQDAFSLECTTDLVLSDSCSKTLSPAEKTRRNLSEQAGISTMSKTFAPPFFTLIRVFIPVFNNL